MCFSFRILLAESCKAVGIFWWPLLIIAWFEAFIYLDSPAASLKHYSCIVIKSACMLRCSTVWLQLMDFFALGYLIDAQVWVGKWPVVAFKCPIWMCLLIIGCAMLIAAKWSAHGCASHWETIVSKLMRGESWLPTRRLTCWCCSLHRMNFLWHVSSLGVVSGIWHASN